MWSRYLHREAKKPLAPIRLAKGSVFLHDGRWAVVRQINKTGSIIVATYEEDRMNVPFILNVAR